ncbi:MAG: hypothetical protein E7668_02910 [Ruminococcaceae bacterium]|nr:hypothetical protein [Oscillospiraceae bacterium]
MFEIGSYVIYRAEGVCKISDIRNESFGAVGGESRYYILSPLNDEKSTVFVPTDNNALLGMMRPLMSAEEICRLVMELKNERMEWIPESRARNTKFKEVLSLGDRRELIVLVNTVHEHMEEAVKCGKKPTGTDENAIRRAIRLLYEEFAATTDLKTEEDIIPLLRGELCLHNK